MSAQDSFGREPRLDSLRLYPYTPIDFLRRGELGRATQDVLNRASGGSALLLRPGSSGHRHTWERSVGPGLVADATSLLSPLGQRWLVVSPAALNRETLIARQATLDPARRPSVLTPPHKIEVEGAVGGSLQASSRNVRTSTVSLMARLQTQRSFPGTATTVGLGIGFQMTRHAAEASHLRVGRTVTRKDSGYQVVVAVPVNLTVAAVSSVLGVGPRVVSWPEPGSAMAVHRDTMTLSLPASARLEGMERTPFGPMPRYDTVHWSPPPWLRQVPFGGWPVNALNPAQSLAAFERQVRRLGLADHDVEHLRWLVSDRVVRALDGEMAGPGVSVPVQVGRWGSTHLRAWFASRQVQLRVQLVPTERVRFYGLGHSVELEENLYAEEADQQSRGRASGAVVGVVAGQGIATGDPQMTSAGPVYSQSGSAGRSTSVTETNSGSAGSIVTHTQVHGSVAQEYRLRVVLESTSGGRIERIAGAEEDAGYQVKHYPGALLSALDEGDELRPQALPPASAPRRVVVPVPAGVDRWRDVGASNDLVEMPSEGFAVRGIHGLDEVRDGITLALGAAYDASLTLPVGQIGRDELDSLLLQARRTPFTSLGSMAGTNLRAATTDLAMAALYPRMLTSDGYEVPLRAAGLVGDDHASVRLWSKLHRAGARLLTWEYGVKFETLDQISRGGASVDASSHSGSQAVEVGPTSTSGIGATQSGGMLGSRATAAVASTHSHEGLGSVNVKPDHREIAYLYAFRATWLMSAQAHRAVKDSEAMALVRGVFHQARRVPQAVEVDAWVVAWVSEKVARDLGLLTGSHVGLQSAAREVQRATQAWITAAKQYEDLVHVAGEQRRGELDAAREHLRELERHREASRAAVEEAREVIRAWEEDLAEPEGGWRDVAVAAVEQARAVVRRHGEADRELAVAASAVAFAQALVDEVQADVQRWSPYTEELSVEYARVRQEADRLITWHGLTAERRNELLGRDDVALPGDVTFMPPVAPVLRSAAGAPSTSKAVKPAVPHVRQELHDADVNRAHTAAPWSRQPGPIEGGWAFDGSGDHRSLTATDPVGRNHVLRLQRPEVDGGGRLRRPVIEAEAGQRWRAASGNGFWAAVVVAGNRTEEPSELARRVVGVRLPDDVPVHLDPRAVFRLEEMEESLPDAFGDNAGRRAAIRREGGLVPDELRDGLTRQQTEALLRTNLMTARRWDAQTTALAAALFVRTQHTDLIVVEEDGSHRYYADPAATEASDRLPPVVYRRGGYYLAAVPEQTSTLPAEQRGGAARAQRPMDKGKRPQRDAELDGAGEVKSVRFLSPRAFGGPGTSVEGGRGAVVRGGEPGPERPSAAFDGVLAEAVELAPVLQVLPAADVVAAFEILSAVWPRPSGAVSRGALQGEWVSGLVEVARARVRGGDDAGRARAAELAPGIPES
ncbi:hypothetical protein AB0F07_38100 [Streptomyces fructofermentans]|uniref:hypothetical protein n=1 Tax=Streptomyces fructofermentans TaxID=152141 RepID=UPI0033C1BE7B